MAKKKSKPEELDHVLWSRFVLFCVEEKVNPRKPQEYLPYWRAFSAGAIAGAEATMGNVVNMLSGEKI